MNRKLIRIDLQHFADEIEVPDSDFEGIEIPESEETDTEEETNDNEEETEEEADTEDFDSEEEPEDKPTDKQLDKQKDDGKIPRNVLIAERKKYQEKIKDLENKARIADRMAEATGKTPDQIIAEIDSWKAQTLVEKEGLPEAYAKDLVAKNRRISEMEETLKVLKYSAEIESIKKQFPGIVAHQDEVVEFANKHGMTAKQAYLALHGEDVYTDMQTLAEQRALANQQKKAGSTIDTKPAGQQKQPKISLTKEQLKFAEEVGMSPAEYQKAMRSTSYESYQKNFKKG